MAMEASMYSFEKRIKHYSSYQKILLVGEGDFSFALSLCRAFGSAINMVATSLDSRELLMVKYSKAMSNVMELESRGCIVWHEVDVHSMSQHPFMIERRFDRIIYNFPHAGFLHSESNKFQIRCHQNLIRGFFRNARELLTEIGEIHVTHKTTVPFRDWKIVELAQELGLYLVHEEHFSKGDYPGYENKRGDGMCDLTFYVGPCSTFMFTKLLYPSSVSGFHLGAGNCDQSFAAEESWTFRYATEESTDFRFGKRLHICAQPCDLSIIRSLSDDIIDKACTYLERIDRRKSKQRGYKI